MSYHIPQYSRHSAHQRMTYSASLTISASDNGAHQTRPTSDTAQALSLIYVLSRDKLTYVAMSRGFQATFIILISMAVRHKINVTN